MSAIGFALNPDLIDVRYQHDVSSGEPIVLHIRRVSGGTALRKGSRS